MKRLEDTLAACTQPTAPMGPVRVAVDNYYSVTVEELGYHGGLHASPGLLAEAVTGLLLRDGLVGAGAQAEIVDMVETGRRRYSVLARVRRAAARPPPGGPVGWAAVEAAYRDFVSRVSKRRCPFAVHTVAAYSVHAGEPRLALLVSDVSRHAAALKAAGVVSRLASHGEPPVLALTTSRVSGDMVAALARAGVRVLVSNHHPVLSGIEEAWMQGVELVLRAPGGHGLAAYTQAGILVEAPRVRLGPAPGGGAGAYAGLPSPLC